MTRNGSPTDGTPTDALSVLGNEIRMSILRELAEASGPVSYSDLRRRVGLRDSGKFNYHLTRLLEYFVREADGGYELGYAGSRVIAAGTVGNGAERANGESDPTDGSVTCPVCGGEDCDKLFHVHLRSPWG